MENTEDVLSSIKDTFSSIKDESSKYANTVIMIIIFLIFLNLFMTTYFYFTSLITANANRSNCGAGGITEAETFRHIFLQDNGNDKTRDIYIIIIAIFAIYMFSEMFKIFEMSDFDINDNHKYIGSILSFILGCVLFIINLSTLVSVLMSVLMSALENDSLKVPVITLLVFLGLVVILYIVNIVVNFVIDRNPANILPPADVNDRNGFFNDKNTKTAFIVFMCIFFISQISLIYSNKNFKNNGFKLINSNFNEFTAMVLMFLVFFILCGIHSLVYGIKLINSWYYLLLLFFSLCLFMFILVSSLDLSFDKNTDEPTHKQLTSIIDFFLAFKWLALLIPFFILIGISFNNSNYRESLIDPTPFIKTLVFYYVLLFVAFLFYVYFMNKESTTGILSLQYFQLYNYNSENSNEEIKNTTDGKESNFYKKLNISNATFVGLFLVILIILLTFAKNNKSTNNLIYGMIVFIIASYVTGIVYLIYNKIFPIQQLSFDYKKNLIDINNEISNHIKTVDKEHTIDKDKIFNFNTFSVWSEVTTFKGTLHAEPAKTKKEKLELIKNEFRKIAPKGENYDKYVDQSKDQKEYEEYILNIFDDTIFGKIDIDHFTAENKKITTILNASSITPVEKTDRIITQMEFTDFYTTLNTDTIRKATPEYKTILLDILTKQYSDVKSSLSDEIQNIIKKSDSDTEYTKAIQAINNKIILIKNIETLTPNEIKTINAIISNIMNMILSKTNDELKLEIYRKLIIDVPKNLNELKDNNDIKYFSKSTKLDIPVSNNLEYIIKKNYKYVTGEEGEIQKYNAKSNTFIDNNKTLTPTELNGKYWIKINNESSEKGFKLEDSIPGDFTKIIIKPDLNSNRKLNLNIELITGTVTGYRELTGTVTYLSTSQVGDLYGTVTKLDNTVLKITGKVTVNTDATITGTVTVTVTVTGTTELTSVETVSPAISNITGTFFLRETAFTTISIDDSHKIYAIKDYDKIKQHFSTTTPEDVHFLALKLKDGKVNLFVSYNVINTDIKTINSKDVDLIASYKKKDIIDKINDIIIEPVFYTIGYDYNNYKADDNNNQVILRDKLYALPAKYYACAYLNYHPKSDEYMNTMKFKDYIDEKHYEIYKPDKDNIVTKIAKRYNTIVEDAKKDLDPKKFYFLLIFLVILAILLLMYFFNLAKVYIPDTEYSLQMYVLGILAVFLTVFIFGEVIFSRIK